MIGVCELVIASTTSGGTTKGTSTSASTGCTAAQGLLLSYR
jgi:hypothetical protein